MVKEKTSSEMEKASKEMRAKAQDQYKVQMDRMLHLNTFCFMLKRKIRIAKEEMDILDGYLTEIEHNFPDIHLKGSND